jgi:cytochrome P450
MRAIHAHVDALIGRARARLHDDGGAAPRNLLEAMLVAAGAPDAGLTDADIKANVLTLLLAGEDTTAHTLAWTMYFLAQRPELQAQLHAQARGAFAGATVCPDHEALRGLDTFEAAASEATRLRPIVPLFFLEPQVDVELGGVRLPSGTPMFFLLRPAMLDDRHFADAAEFRPQRWAAGHEAQPHDMRSYLQFGAGPRVCPGRHLAGVEIRLVLSMLMRSFSLSLAVDPAAVREVMAFTMTPDRMPVRLTALH